MVLLVSDWLCVLQTSVVKSSAGFVEGSTRPFVYNLLLLPGEVKAFSVRFTPVSNHSVSSLLIVRYVPWPCRPSDQPLLPLTDLLLSSSGTT